MEIAVERIHDVDEKDYCAAYTVYAGDCRVLAILTYMTTTASKWIKDVVKSNPTKPGTIVVGVSVDPELPPSEKGGLHNYRYDLLQICVGGSHCLLFHLPEPFEVHSCVKFLDDLFNDPRVVAVGVDMVSVAKNLDKHHGISVRNPVNLQSLAAEKLKRDDLDRLAKLVIGKHMYVVRPGKKVQWFAWEAYAAALSGIASAMANHIADYFQSGGAQSDEFVVGLHKEFQPLKGHDIGQFPGLESKEVANEAQAYQLTTRKHIRTKRLYGFGNCIGC